MANAAIAYDDYCTKSGLRQQSVARSKIVNAVADLDFSDLYLGPKQCGAIISVLPHLPDLRRVSFNGAGMSDDLVEAMCTVFLNHEYLQTIDIGGSNGLLTDRSATAALQLAKKCPALETVILPSLEVCTITEMAAHKLKLQLDLNTLTKKRMSQQKSSNVATSIANKYLELTGGVASNATGGLLSGLTSPVSALRSPLSSTPSKSNAHRAVMAIQGATPPPSELTAYIRNDEDTDNSGALVPRVTANISIGSIRKNGSIAAAVDQLFPEDWECSTNADDEELLAEEVFKQQQILDPLPRYAQQTSPQSLQISPVPGGEHGNVQYQPVVPRDHAVKDSIDPLPKHRSIDQVIPELLKRHREMLPNLRAEALKPNSDADTPPLKDTLRFTDEEFPPAPNSICSRLSVMEAIQQTEAVAWRRIGELVALRKQSEAKGPSTVPYDISDDQPFSDYSGRDGEEEENEEEVEDAAAHAPWFAGEHSSYVASGWKHREMLRAMEAQKQGGDEKGALIVMDSQRNVTAKNPSTLFPRIANQWFVNALNVVRRNPALANTLLVKAHPDLGLYVVRFFKNGLPVEVMVDDFVPVDRSNPTKVLYACTTNPSVATDGDNAEDARNELPCDVWAAILEKAYAKLHGGYDRLGSGSICNALQDLTNGYLYKWQWDLPTATKLMKAPIAQGSQIPSHAPGSALVADWIKSLLRRSDTVAAQAKARGVLPKSALLAAGILPNAAYIVDAVISDVGPEQYTVVRLVPPNPNLEWTGGKFGAGSEELAEFADKLLQRTSAGRTQPLRTAPAAADGRVVSTALTVADDLAQQMLLNSPLQRRFVFMAIEDFIGFFSSIISLKYPHTSPKVLSAHTIVHRGYWVEESAGGLLDSPNWSDNPAFYLRAERNYTEVTLELNQRDARLMQSYNATSSSPLYSTIQIVAFALDDDDPTIVDRSRNERRRLLPLSRLVAAVACSTRTVSVRIPVHPRRAVYVVIANDNVSMSNVAVGASRAQPNPRPPRGSYRYKLRAISSAPFSLEEVPAGKHIRCSVKAKWSGPTASGRLSIDGVTDAGLPKSMVDVERFKMGCRNPQFLITTKFKQKVSIVLTQEVHDPSSAISAEGIHRPPLFAIALHAIYNQNVAIGECRAVDRRTDFERRKSVAMEVDTTVLWKEPSSSANSSFATDNSRSSAPSPVDGKSGRPSPVVLQTSSDGALSARSPMQKPPLTPPGSSIGLRRRSPEPTQQPGEATSPVVKPLPELVERSVLVIPATWGSGEEGHFTLTVYSEWPVEVTRVNV